MNSAHIQTVIENQRVQPNPINCTKLKIKTTKTKCDHNAYTIGEMQLVFEAEQTEGSKRQQKSKSCAFCFQSPGVNKAEIGFSVPNS